VEGVLVVLVSRHLVQTFWVVLRRPFQQSEGPSSVLWRLHWLQSGLLVLVVLPVVAQDGQRVRDALSRVLHLQLDWVLTVIHLFVVLVLLDSEDSLLSVRLLGVDGEYHVIGDEGFLWLLARLVQDSQVVPHFPQLVLQSRCLGNVLE